MNSWSLTWGAPGFLKESGQMACLSDLPFLQPTQQQLWEACSKILVTTWSSGSLPGRWIWQMNHGYHSCLRREMIVAWERDNFRDIQRCIDRDLKPDWIWRPRIWRQTLNMAVSGVIFLPVALNFQHRTSQSCESYLADHTVTSTYSCTQEEYPRSSEWMQAVDGWSKQHMGHRTATCTGLWGIEAWMVGDAATVLLRERQCTLTVLSWSHQSQLENSKPAGPVFHFSHLQNDSVPSLFNITYHDENGQDKSNSEVLLCVTEKQNLYHLQGTTCPECAKQVPKVAILSLCNYG